MQMSLQQRKQKWNLEEFGKGTNDLFSRMMKNAIGLEPTVRQFIHANYHIGLND